MLGHYNAGKRQMRDGDLLLIDFAPDYGYYMSDLTRMWPVNGKFSTSQRELYEFYAECYHALLKAIKPGLTAQAVLQFAVREMDGILAKTGLSEQLHNQAAKAFVESFRQSSKNPRAMFGRWVSMSTHDVGQDNGRPDREADEGERLAPRLSSHRNCGKIRRQLGNSVYPVLPQISGILMVSSLLHSETCLGMFLSRKENRLFVVPKCPETLGILEKTALVRQLRCVSRAQN